MIVLIMILFRETSRVKTHKQTNKQNPKKLVSPRLALFLAAVNGPDKYREQPTFINTEIVRASRNYGKRWSTQAPFH